MFVLVEFTYERNQHFSQSIQTRMPGFLECSCFDRMVILVEIDSSLDSGEISSSWLGA